MGGESRPGRLGRTLARVRAHPPVAWVCVAAVLVGCALAAPAALGALTATPVATTTTTVTLSPVADAFVNTALPKTNYGKDPSLYTSASQYHGLLRFDLGSIPATGTITSAKLSLFSTNAVVGGGVRVHPSLDTWDVKTVTASNQPAWNTAVLATSAAPTANARVTATLPTTAVAPGRRVSWGIDYSLSGRQANLVSVDNATVSRRPQLVITYTTPIAPTPPPVNTATATATTATATATSTATATATATLPTAAPVSLGTPRTRGTMPGDAGLPTVAVNPPALKLSAAGAGTVVPNPAVLTETSPYARVVGAHTTRSVYPDLALADSITPVNSTAFQTYGVEIRSDAPVLDVRFQGDAGRYRVSVDGHPLSIGGSTTPSGGALYRLTLTFPDRQMRTIRYESDAARFNSFTVSQGDVVEALPSRLSVPSSSVTASPRAPAPTGATTPTGSCSARWRAGTTAGSTDQGAPATSPTARRGTSAGRPFASASCTTC